MLGKAGPAMAGKSHSGPLLSHRISNKGGLVQPRSGTMELPETIDPQRRTKPWDIIAQCSANS